MTHGHDHDVPKYRRRVILTGGWVPGPGESVVVAVNHAGGCPGRHGQPCTCNPVIELRPAVRPGDCGGPRGVDR